MFQSVPNLYERVNSGLCYGNLDFNFNVYAENPAELRTKVLKCTLSLEAC